MLSQEGEGTLWFGESSSPAFLMIKDGSQLINYSELSAFCAGQEATVRTGHGTTDWIQIEKGVHTDSKFHVNPFWSTLPSYSHWTVCCLALLQRCPFTLTTEFLLHL